jgi:hypothetical protein
LGVSRQGQGEFENTRKQLSAFQKNSPGKWFFGGGDFFWTFFSIEFFVALVKRLSVREKKKNVIKNVLRGRASKFFPLADFFNCGLAFGAFLDKGNSEMRLKKSRHRTRV